MQMIETILLDYLEDTLKVPVWAEFPQNPPEKLVIVRFGDTTRENLLGIASGGRLMDLSGAKALAPYAERMICMQTQAGETVPVGIDLTGCPAFERLGFYPDGVCLGVSAYTQRLESVRIWLDFLFLLEK